MTTQIDGEFSIYSACMCDLINIVEKTMEKILIELLLYLIFSLPETTKMSVSSVIR